MDLARKCSRLEDGEERRLIKAAQGGDKEALARVVKANIRLVINCVCARIQNVELHMDLVNEGSIGLIEAVKRFDPERCDPDTGKLIKFGTFSVWWIRQSIQRARQRNGTARLYIPVWLYEPMLRGQTPVTTNTEFVEAAKRAFAHETYVHLDSMFRGHGDELCSVSDVVPDGEPSALDRFLAEEERAAVRRFVRDVDLDKPERMILEERLLADEPRTLGDIGSKCGLSRERMRRREVELIAWMRRRLVATGVCERPAAAVV
jgi:RNA polymerase sigma-32 factor